MNRAPDSPAPSGGSGEPAAYRNPALTVDGVVLARRRPGENFSVLLVERGNEPFRGCFALPGGFVDYGEDIADAIGREIAEETGLVNLPFRQFGTYGAPDRDPRGHIVSVVYVAVIEDEPSGPPEPVAGDDAAAAAWHPIDSLPDLAFDHGRILADVLRARAHK